MDLGITWIDASCSIRKRKDSRHSKMGAGLSDLDESLTVIYMAGLDARKKALCRLAISSANVEQNDSNSMDDVLGFNPTKLLEEFNRSVKIAYVLHHKPFQFRDHWERVMISSERLR